MNKFSKLFVSVSVGVLLGQAVLPTTTVMAETINTSVKDKVIYSDDSIVLQLKEDSSVQKVVEEVSKIDGTIRSFTLNKNEQKITISSSEGEVSYTSQELIDIGSRELGRGYGFRTANYAGWGSIGYNYTWGNYYLKITSNGSAHEKNVTRNSSNAGYLDAFKDAVDDIKNTQWSIVASLGFTAAGALFTGGIGAFSLLTSSVSLIAEGKKIIALTDRAHRYFWNV